MTTLYSHSRLSAFENCPKKFEFRYVKQIRPETEGIEAFVGKRVHEILERLYRFVADGLLPSLDKVLARYHANFEAQFDAARVRIAREGTDAGFYRDFGARGLENYYRRHYPFDADQTLGLERPIQFALDEDGRYAVRGIIDRVARARDGVLEIHDFKTGRRIPRQDDLDRDRQLRAASPCAGSSSPSLPASCADARCARAGPKGRASPSASRARRQAPGGSRRKAPAIRA